MFIEENMADNTEIVAESQPTTEVQTEVTTPATEVQGTQEDITQTQTFSKRLNEMTQKNIDAEYSRLFGADYGIHTKADYDKAIAEQKAEEERARLQQETGIDPNSLKPIWEQMKETDPDFQELKSIRQEKNMTTSLTDLNNELKDAGIDLQLKDLSLEEIAKLPNVDKITEIVKRGHTLADAFFLANKKDIISKQSQAAEQAAIKKIVANGASSPGSLSTGTETETLFTKEQVDKMSKADVLKNYDQIIKSTKKW
jgi:hypothetical protein